MFWIHGGGFYEGSASEFGGVSPLVSKDIVLVTINYRLGVVGTYSHYLSLMSLGLQVS